MLVMVRGERIWRFPTHLNLNQPHLAAFRMKLSNPLSSWKARHNAVNGNGASSSSAEKHEGYDDSPLPRLTWTSFSMGILVSMVLFSY